MYFLSLLTFAKITASSLNALAAAAVAVTAVMVLIATSIPRHLPRRTFS